jgi:photosystem II stability/assembly factor-like uncharacterized protein
MGGKDVRVCFLGADAVWVLGAGGTVLSAKVVGRVSVYKSLIAN